MKAFLPYRGEFGFNVMAHAPQVHAALTPGVDVVFCEPGNEAMYPGAREYLHVSRREDSERRVYNEMDLLMWAMKQSYQLYGDDVVCVSPDLDARRSYFVPEPYKRRGITADVVICPRRRDYGSDKNWPHWQALADLLMHESSIDTRTVVYAAGAPDSSYDIKCDGLAWDHKRFLDASIEAILSARLVIATDAGLAHLAVMCGRPLLMISYSDECLVAPGTDDMGRPYWPIKIERYHQANHQQSTVCVVQDGWDRLDRTYQAAMSTLEGSPCSSGI